MFQEIEYYTSLLYPTHNIIFAVVLVLLYSMLCFYVIKIRGFANGKIDKTQLQVGSL